MSLSQRLGQCFLAGAERLYPDLVASIVDEFWLRQVDLVTGAFSPNESASSACIGEQDLGCS